MEQSRDDGHPIAGKRRRRSEWVQTAKRSRKGCPECRQRKIKCDERQPQCGQCQKSNRACHLQDSIFRRHTFSSEGSVVTTCPIRTEADDPLEVRTSGAPIYGVQNAARTGTGAGNAEADRSPRDAHGFPALPEYSHSVAPSNHHVPTENLPLETLAVPGAAEELQLEGKQGDGSIPGTGGSSESPVDNDSSRDIESPVSPSTTHSISEESTIESRKDTQEELFLLRHYSECIAPWMDLLYRYEVFSREVLTLAREHPILRYAACAVAAKQLGQIKRPFANVMRGKTQVSIATRLARGRLGFLWYGIKYYEKAIQSLVKSIAPEANQTARSANNHASPAVSLSGGDLMVRAEGEDPIVRLLGTCILIQYEHLSANRDAWSGHLTGFSKLLVLIDDGRLLHQHPTFEQVYPWTKDIMEVKAGFWNFVANDVEESFVSHRRTRIDTENVALWRNMGLLIDDEGRLTLRDGPHSLSTTPEHARDKVLSYTLIRLLCKLVDYLAAPPAYWNSLLVHGESSSTTYGKAAFVHLESQFDAWFQMLSPSFHPDGIFLSTNNNGDDGEAAASGQFSCDENWFSNDLCSTTIMYYHMARMLLLIHRPPDLLQDASSKSKGVSSDLLRTFRAIEQKLQFHAYQVISTVRGTPCDAVKLRAIQPLYVAGRCCTHAGDRSMVVEMLADIQDSLGIATGYRVKALLEEWGTSYRDPEVEARLAAEEQLV